ncbi:MAG: hypothetical protein U9O94_02470 [Nanoarchaeota archaeon]|nr:hypothetical protein [Nanoarchaeota archaeon]
MLSHYAKKKEQNKVLKIKTADYTLLPMTEDMWATFSNSGASGTGTGGGVVAFQLPAAKVGMGFRFLVQAACRLSIAPASGETIAVPSTGAQGTADYVIHANAIGESVELECKVEGDWDCNKYIGTWTSSAAI